MRIWTDFFSILLQITRLTDGRIDRQTDGRTDRQTEFSSLDRVCIPCSAVKMPYSAEQWPVFVHKRKSWKQHITDFNDG